MITLEQEKEQMNEIEEAKAKAKDPKIKVGRVEVRTESDGTYVGYFKKPRRNQIKKLSKQYEDDRYGYFEAVARENLVYPDRETFEDVADYCFGAVFQAGNQLLVSAGFGDKSEAKNFE